MFCYLSVWWKKFSNFLEHGRSNNTMTFIQNITFSSTWRQRWSIYSNIFCQFWNFGSQPFAIIFWAVKERHVWTSSLPTKIFHLAKKEKKIQCNRKLLFSRQISTIYIRRFHLFRKFLFFTSELYIVISDPLEQFSGFLCHL